MKKEFVNKDNDENYCKETILCYAKISANHT